MRKQQKKSGTSFKKRLLFKHYAVCRWARVETVWPTHGVKPDYYDLLRPSSPGIVIYYCLLNGLCNNNTRSV